LNTVGSGAKLSSNKATGDAIAGDVKNLSTNVRFAPMDSVVSLIPSGATGTDIKCDFRLIATTPSTAPKDPGQFFTVNPLHAQGELLAHSLQRNPYSGGRADNILNPAAGGATLGNLVAGITSILYDPLENSAKFYGWSRYGPDVPPGINGVTNSLGGSGDWDSGFGTMPDGPWTNWAMEGQDIGQGTPPKVPYFGTFDSGDWLYNVEGKGFSANRIIASPVAFGSLPTGVKAGKPWQTLLFRPDRSYLPGGNGGRNHPGSAAFGPPDHLLLDHFWMPIAEPYPISQPFSTAGKVNLNYQIAPFTYIKRDTAMRGVLESVKLTAVDPLAETLDTGTKKRKYVNVYKQLGIDGSETHRNLFGASGLRIRYDLDNNATLRQFDQKFSTNRPFVSASEICDIPLIPTDANVDSTVSLGSFNTEVDTKMGAFWGSRNMTGDNLLERPYGLIYPRVTTKSNTYTVHVRVQTLQKIRSDTEQNKWKSTDVVTGEFRGAYVLERYLDPNQDTFDASDPNATLGPYKFRVIGSKQFAP
jgi:uncharacterized protein (TIGR02600 family)